MKYLLPLIASAALALLVAPAAVAAKTNCFATGAPVCVRATLAGKASPSGSYKPARLATIASTVPIVKIKWSSWTAQRAVGRGRLVRCAVCDRSDESPVVTVVLQRPIAYFCGAQPRPIGTWFTRATVTSATLGTRQRKIIDEGHPNAC